MLVTNERHIVDRDGRPVEVVLPGAEFEQLKAQAQTAEILRRFAAGASLAELAEEYGLGRLTLSDLIAEHGLDPNRYDVEEVRRDQAVLARIRARRRPDA